LNTASVQGFGTQNPVTTLVKTLLKPFAGEFEVENRSGGYFCGWPSSVVVCAQIWFQLMHCLKKFGEKFFT
jgi:hypothetical protein